ncbi:MAG: hypothetical protein ACE5Z5_11670 [Candidatus Bathyarchaeia archaeon]
MKSVKRAIDQYNRYRSPEATAKIFKIREGTLTVEFSGPFCETCGVYDWFEDLKYELEAIDQRLQATITQIQRRKSGAYTVLFSIMENLEE